MLFCVLGDIYVYTDNVDIYSAQIFSFSCMHSAHFMFSSKKRHFKKLILQIKL